MDSEIIKEMQSIAEFYRIVKNYLIMIKCVTA